MLVMTAAAGSASVLSVRSRATYLAGSQYITWLSLNDGPHQHRRVGAAARGCCTGSRRASSAYCSGIVRVAPLLVLAHRQRQRGVEHRVEHVDERHLRHHAPNRSGRRLTTAPISSPPALPPSITSRSRRRSPAHQVLGAGDEVGEGVHLLRPSAPRRATACPGRRRRGCGRWRRPSRGRAGSAGWTRSRSGTGSRRSRSRQQQRRRAVPRRVLPVDERDRARCVPSGAGANSRSLSVLRPGRSRRAPPCCLSSVRVARRHVVVVHRRRASRATGS